VSGVQLPPWPPILSKTCVRRLPCAGQFGNKNGAAAVSGSRPRSRRQRVRQAQKPLRMRHLLKMAHPHLHPRVCPGRKMAAWPMRALAASRFSAVSGGGGIRISGVEDPEPANLLSMSGNWGMTQWRSASTDGARREARKLAKPRRLCPAHQEPLLPEARSVRHMGRGVEMSGDRRLRGQVAEFAQRTCAPPGLAAVLGHAAARHIPRERDREVRDRRRPGGSRGRKSGEEHAQPIRGETFPRDPPAKANSPIRLRELMRAL